MALPESRPVDRFVLAAASFLCIPLAIWLGRSGWHVVLLAGLLAVAGVENLRAGLRLRGSRHSSELR